MGNVKDRNFRFAETGDEYVGRCLALNPVLSVTLAASPPFFDENIEDETDIWLKQLVEYQFAYMNGVPHFGRLNRMCLASLLYHRVWIESNLAPNHVV